MERESALNQVRTRLTPTRITRDRGMESPTESDENQTTLHVKRTHNRGED